MVAISVLCLGLGIGANTTVFSVVNGLLLQPISFPEPHRLVVVSEVHQGSAHDTGRVSYPNFRDWREHGAAVAEMAALRARAIVLSDHGVRERYSAALITWNLFPMLGVQPMAGRGFREYEDDVGAAPVVLLSEALWQQRYAADAAVIGQSITIDGRSHTVIGVMPPLRPPRPAGRAPRGAGVGPAGARRARQPAGREIAARLCAAPRRGRGKRRAGAPGVDRRRARDGARGEPRLGPDDARRERVAVRDESRAHHGDDGRGRLRAADRVRQRGDPGAGPGRIRTCRTASLAC